MYICIYLKFQDFCVQVQRNHESAEATTFKDENKFDSCPHLVSWYVDKKHCQRTRGLSVLTKVTCSGLITSYYTNKTK